MGLTKFLHILGKNFNKFLQIFTNIYKNLQIFTNFYKFLRFRKKQDVQIYFSSIEYKVLG